MDPRQLYESLNDDNKNQLRRLAAEIGEKYTRGDKAGQYKGKVILFLGAAANYHATKAGFESCYRKTDRPPLAYELGNMYIDELFAADSTTKRSDEMKEEKLGLSWITQYYQERFDRADLISKLATYIDNRKPSPILNALAEMPFKYIVSTNYDNLFEEALENAGKTYHKGIYKPNRAGKSEYTVDFDESTVSVTNPFVYKLHGDIREVFDSNENYVAEKDAIVLTDEDYLHFILRMSQITHNLERGITDTSTDLYPIPESINNAFSGINGNTFLFVGYGLRDYNLRLIFKTALWKKDVDIFKALQKWSIALAPDESIKNIWIRDYRFTFIEDDIWCVIPYLYKEMFGKEMPL
jgi:hypothetical protein